MIDLARAGVAAFGVMHKNSGDDLLAQGGHGSGAQEGAKISISGIRCFAHGG